MLLPLLPFLACLAAAGEPDAPVLLRGRVVDARTARPVSGASIRPQPEGTPATSDADGRFAVEVRSGAASRLLVTARGYAPASVPTEAASPLEVRLEPLPGVREELEVTAAGPAPLPALPLARAYSGEELQELSSVLASDPLRSAQALPGLAANDDFSAGFAARGSGFASAALLLDGVLLHAPWHTMRDVNDGYSLTVFNGEVVEGVTLVGGGAPAPYGERTGPVVSFRTRTGSRERVAGRGSLAVSGLLGTLEGPLGRSASWLVSARKSYLDWILRRVDDAPRWALGYHDLTAKLSLEPRPGTTLSLLGLGGRARWENTEESPSPHELASSRAGTDLLALHARSLVGSRLQLRAVAALVRETGRNLDSDGLRRYDSRLDHRDLRLEASFEGRRHRLEVGTAWRRLAEAATSRAWDAALRTPRLIASYDERADQWSAFAQDTWSLGPLELTGGLRVDAFSWNDTSVILPRLSAAWKAGGATRLVAAFGRYAAFPSYEALAGEHGNPALEPERSRHLVLALERRLRPDLGLRVEAYHQSESDLIGNLALDHRLVEGRPTAPDAGAILLNAFQGPSRGVEVTLEARSAQGLSASLAYALSHACRDDASGARFDSDFDQRHTLSAIARRRWRRWGFAVALRHGSGFPVAGFLAASGTEIVLAAERNGYRPADYTRLDARGEHRFRIRGAQATLYLELANVLDHRNLRYTGIDSVNLRTGRVRLDSDEMLPVLPLFGLAVAF